MQQQSFHPTAVQPYLNCISEETEGVVTLQAAQAGLKRQLQSSVDSAEAVNLESKTLAAQMVAQVEAHKQELSLMQVGRVFITAHAAMFDS